MLRHGHEWWFTGLGRRIRAQYPAFDRRLGLTHLVPRRADLAVVLVIVGALGMVVGVAVLHTMVVVVPMALLLVGSAWRLFRGDDR
jgi:hypothetical protein